MEPSFSNILLKPHRTYKKRNQYKNAINFSSSNANLITFNSLFGNSSGDSSNPKLYYTAELFYSPDNKKIKAKARKDVIEKKKAEVIEKKRVVTKVAREKKKFVVEVAKEKKRVVAKVAKEKK